MDWRNLKGLLTTKLKEAESSLGRLVKMTSPKVKEESRTSLVEKHSSQDDADENDQIEDLQALHASLENKIAVAQKVLEGKDKQLIEKDKRILELKNNDKYFQNGKIKTISEILEEYSKNLAKIENNYKEVLKQRDGLKKDLNRQIEGNSSVSIDLEIEKLLDEEFATKQKIDSFKQDLDELKEVNEANLSRIHDLKNILVSSKQELEEISSKVSESIDKENSAKQLFLDLKTQNNTEKQQLDEYQSKISTLDGQISYMEGSKISLLNDKENYNKMKNDLVTSLEHEKESIKEDVESDHNKNVLELQAAMESKLEESENAYQSLLANIDTVRDEISDLERSYIKKILKLESELELAETKHFQLSHTTISVNRPILKHINRLQQQIAQLECDIKNEEEIRASKLQSLGNDVAMESNKMTESQRISNQLKKRIDKKRKTIQEYQTKVDMLISHVESIELRSSHLKLEMDSLTAQSSKYTLEVEELDERNTCLEAKCVELKREQDERMKLKTSNEEDKEKTLEAMETSDQDDGEQTTQIVESGHPDGSEFHALQKELHETQNAVNELELELGTIKATSKRYKTLIVDFEDAKKKQEELNVRYMATIDVLGEKMETLSELNGTIKKMKSSYQEDINNLCLQLESIKKGNSISTH